MNSLLLVALVLLPLGAAGGSLFLGPERAARAVQLSVATAILLVLLATVSAVDVELALPAGRALTLKATAQVGLQLLGLAMLGFVMSLTGEPPRPRIGWLAVAWLCMAGLTVALLAEALPLALLVFLGAGLLWALGPPPEDRPASGGIVMRYTALLALAMPLFLIAFRLAEIRAGEPAPDIERLALALVVPAFALVLGLMPLHAWALTVAAGTPRPMLAGVLLLVQTAGYVICLRTLASHPWMGVAAREALVIGGCVSAVLGAWLALSARRDDPDDWLVYATVANGGMLVAGLGAQSRSAGIGVVILLFARVLAIVVAALAPRVTGPMRRFGNTAALLTLAGTPGLVGFPGLWLILHALQAAGHAWAPAGLLTGSGLLFATAVRRWPASPDGRDPAAEADPGARRAIASLIVLMTLLGLLPFLVAATFGGAIRDMFFANP